MKAQVKKRLLEEAAESKKRVNAFVNKRLDHKEVGRQARSQHMIDVALVKAEKSIYEVGRSSLHSLINEENVRFDPKLHKMNFVVLC